MQRLRVLIASLLQQAVQQAVQPAVLLAALLLALPAIAGGPRAEETKTPPTAPAAPARPAAVVPGNKVPPLKLSALLPGGKQPAPFDLKASLGSKPLVICYLRLGEALGEEGFLKVQGLAQGPLKGKVEFIGATNPGSKTTVAAAAERLSLLGVELPFVIDNEFELGATLGVTSAPSIALIDAGGVLRVADAKSLKQNVAPATTLLQAIQSAAKGGLVPTVARLPRYYPVEELVGEQYPDFMLKKFEGTDRVKMSEVVARDLKEKKLPVLFFWHPNCPHCKKAMPAIMVGYKSYARWLDLISIVDLKNADEIRNTEDTIRAHGVTFPVLQDEDRRITDMYKVVSTPTFVFLKPDGVVDSVFTSGDINYVTVFSAKIRSVLGVASPGK
jgi:peroxiredoxin